MARPRHSGSNLLLLGAALVVLVLAIGGGIVLAGGGKHASGKSASSGGTTPRFLVAGPTGLVLQSGGQNRTLVHFDDGLFITDPSISPDGKKLAFAVQHPATADAKGNIDFGSDLYISDFDGGNMRLVVHHTGTGEFVSRPNWTNDDKQLIFDVRGTDANGDADVRVESLDLATNTRQRLAANAAEPALAPDGKTLAYVFIDPQDQHEQLMLTDLATGKSSPLTGKDATQVFDIELSWSPDGNELAFAAADPSVVAQEPSSGGGLRAASATLPQPSTTDVMLHPFLQDIWVINKDGSNLKRIADIGESQPSVAWSTDGQYVYALGATNFWRIKVSDATRQVIGQGEPSGQVRVLKGP